MGSDARRGYSLGAVVGATLVVVAGAGDTIVSLAVPNETRLRLAVDGDVAAASTKTGRRPSAADTVIVLGDDGGSRPATVAEVEHAVTRFQSGDWREPGVWHAAD